MLSSCDGGPDGRAHPWDGASPGFSTCPSAHLQRRSCPRRTVPPYDSVVVVVVVVAAVVVVVESSDSPASSMARSSARKVAVSTSPVGSTPRSVCRASSASVSSGVHSPSIAPGQYPASLRADWTAAAWTTASSPPRR